MRRLVASVGNTIATRLGQKILLALFALLDLGGRMAASVLDIFAAPALVSLFASDVFVPAIVGWAAGWAMFGTLIYGVTPTVFPSTVAWVTRQPLFKGVTATTSVSIGIIVEGITFKGWFSGSPVSTIDHRWLVVVGIGATIAYVLVLWYLYPAPLLSEHGPLVTLLDGFARFSDVRNSVEESGLSRIEKPLLVVAAVGPCLLICAFLGVIAFGIAIFYPLPEIVVLIYVGVSVVGDEGVPLPADTWTIQIDRRLTIGVSTATWGLKGIVSLVFVILGILMSAFPFIVFVVVGGVLAVNPSVVAGIRPGLWVFLSLYLVSVAMLGGYGLWYWLRVIDRLPYFLDRWAERQPIDVQTDWTWEERPPLVARPPGVFVPWALLFLTVIVSTRTVDRDAMVGIPAGHALLWMGLLAGIGWLIRRGIAAEPQHPGSDGLAIPGAVVIQVTCYALLTDIAGAGTITDALFRIQLPPPRTMPDIVGFVAFLWVLVTFYYLHDAFNRKNVPGVTQFMMEGLIYPLLLLAIAYGHLAGVQLLSVSAVGFLIIMIAVDAVHISRDG